MTTPHRRRWFRFSLRTLFVVVAIAALGCVWFDGQLRTVNARRAMLEKMRVVLEAPSDDESRQIGWLRRWLGDRAISDIAPCDGGATENGEIRAMFPEAMVQ